MQAVFEKETRAKINFPSYDHGYFQQKHHSDFLRLLHNYVKPNEISQSSWRVMKKIGSFIFVTQVSISNTKYGVYSIRRSSSMMGSAVNGNCCSPNTFSSQHVLQDSDRPSYRGVRTNYLTLALLFFGNYLRFKKELHSFFCHHQLSDLT